MARVARASLVVTQVALSLVVLLGAALCVRSLRALQAIDPGLEPARVVTASFDLGLNGYDQTRGPDRMRWASGPVEATSWGSSGTAGKKG